jgi:hypothetical protein
MLASGCIITNLFDLVTSRRRLCGSIHPRQHHSVLLLLFQVLVRVARHPQRRIGRVVPSNRHLRTPDSYVGVCAHLWCSCPLPLCPTPSALGIIGLGSVTKSCFLSIPSKSGLMNKHIVKHIPTSGARLKHIVKALWFGLVWWAFLLTRV